jgi:4-hydroxy-3-methylbut-2-en-1-yl diphosphate synthase IspG/GcpE
LADATSSAGKSLWLDVAVNDDALTAIDARVERLLHTRDACVKVGQKDVVLSITAAAAETAVYAQRRLAARLAECGATNPLFIRTICLSPLTEISQSPLSLGEGQGEGVPGSAIRRAGPDRDGAAERLIPGALVLGSLLCDGLGDVVQCGTIEGGQDETQLTLDVLQGSGTRLSKTDYVACPSCGRTLFDLQSTTERIKAQTSHLVGVKIAIMGCVVNGPGEMADADFGYVGGSPGHVNLYVGKACVERNVPAETADAKLIDLIKSKGRWQEPEPVE